MITKLLEEIENGKDWEEEIFNMACEIAGKITKQVFSQLDKKLCKQRNTKNLRFIKTDKKTLVTRFGPLTINRNYYKDNQSGGYRHLLDEKLGIEKYKSISPHLMSLSTLLATIMPFRDASFTINNLLPKSSSLSHQYIHKALQREAEKYRQRQQAQRTALFENGEIPKGLKQKEVDKLFIEADGTWIHLQREKKRDAEVKLSIAYEGLRQIAKDRYQVFGKTVFAGLCPSKSFWQGFVTKLNYQYKMSKIKNFFLGGDGADWVKKSLDYFKKPSFYLDKFHIVKALKTAFSANSKRVGQALKAIEESNFTELLALLQQEQIDNPDSRKEIKRVSSYLTNNLDYLRKDKNIAGLGTIESNVDKILANRFKKKGMSWCLDGAHNMAKMIEKRLSQPQEQLLTFYTPKPDELFKRAICSTKLDIKQSPGDWLNAGIPAITGPHASRPWVRALKEIAYS